MNKFLIVALFLIISCESTTDSESTINFYKCLLLDSDVTYNYLNDIVEAIKSLDPVKLVNTFSTIYPAILSEVERCKKETNNEIVLNEEETEKNSDSDALDYEILREDYPNYDLSFKVIVIGNSSN